VRWRTSEADGTTPARWGQHAPGWHGHTQERKRTFSQGLYVALRQQVTPDHLPGRVTAAFWTMNSAPGPAGAAVLTALAARIGASAVLVGAGIAFPPSP